MLRGEHQLERKVLIMLKHLLPLLLAISACDSNDAPPATESPIRTIVLVHGAFADGSSWDRVAPLLVSKGFGVMAVHLPLTSLEADVAATRRAIEIAPGPVLLVGHSYGGFVITEAGNHEKVLGLVYLAGFAPDSGESANDLYKDLPPPEWTATAQVDSGGFAWLPRETVARLFAQDLPSADIDMLTAKQGPIALSIFEERITTAAWRSKPATYIRAEHDGIILPELQQRMATRAGSALTNLDSSHVVMLSHANESAAVILEAAGVECPPELPTKRASRPTARPSGEGASSDPSATIGVDRRVSTRTTWETSPTKAWNTGAEVQTSTHQ